MTKTKTAKNLILVSIAVTLLTVLGGSNKVFADNCEENYGGGETCIFNKRFHIDKDVRIINKDGIAGEWEEDKVIKVKESDIVQFRLKIKNLSDKGAGSFDDLKMEDFLPDELIRVGGAGLTEYFDDFDPGETKTFTIKARIEPDEFDRDDHFEKCVVNKAEIKWKGKTESSDTATVCYGNGEPKELPKTGAVSDLFVIGLGLLAAGILAKLTKKIANSK